MGWCGVGMLKRERRKTNTVSLRGKERRKKEREGKRKQSPRGKKTERGREGSEGVKRVVQREE